MKNKLLEQFSAAAEAVGAQVVPCSSVAEACVFISGQLQGSLLLPAFATAERNQLRTELQQAGCTIITENFRVTAESAEGGVTGVNFAIADTGTLVLESTPEDIRLATTLPPKQFALLDPAKIVADGMAAVAPLRQLHQRDQRNYLAYITGPSRTADIERVLTIGVHGPKELFIFLIPGLSGDFLEM